MAKESSDILRTKQDWQIEQANPEDAPRLAAIQINAFKTNKLFQVQFPTPEVVTAFETFLAVRHRAEIEDNHAEVLVVRNEGQVVAFAIWRPPRSGEDAELDVLREWPEGTNVEMIKAWGEVVNAAYQKAMGDRSCYHLDWLVTDSAFERRGLGAMLLGYSLDQARKANLPVYLESTMEARNWYIKRGFQQVTEMSIDLPDSSDIYREVGLLWVPSAP